MSTVALGHVAAWLKGQGWTALQFLEAVVANLTEYKFLPRPTSQNYLDFMQVNPPQPPLCRRSCVPHLAFTTRGL